MAEKKSKKSADYVGFRAKTERQKHEFYKRADTLKEKGISKADIFEAGLLALESGNSKEQLKRKKDKEINERNEYLKKAFDLNKHIEAYNRQLIYIHGFNNLNEKDNVISIKIFNNEGKEIEDL